MKAVRSRLESFLSQAGTLVAEPGASSSVIVTDTPDVLGRIAAYLETENRALTRRVRLGFEGITLLHDDSAEAGNDWSLVLFRPQFAAATSIPGDPLAEAAMLGDNLNPGSVAGTRA